jgi:1-acyl-sn-glycerol-3-phosphate acyltransferase
MANEKARPSIFWVLAALVLPVLNTAVRFEIRNPERLPRAGSYVLAPNHYSEIDPVIMGAVAWKLGRLPRFLAKASLFDVPVVGWFLRRSGQIPVQRDGGVRGGEALTAASDLARDGRIVVVYPEGTLTRDPDLWPMRGKTGAVRLALQAGIPVIPAAHWGTQQLMGRYSKRVRLFPRSTIQVVIGEPVDLSRFRDRSLDSATLTEATAVVMAAITELVEELRDETAPPERWDPRSKNQKETGRFE